MLCLSCFQQYSRWVPLTMKSTQKNAQNKILTPYAGYITEYSVTIKLTMSDKIQSKHLVSIVSVRVTSQKFRKRGAAILED